MASGPSSQALVEPTGLPSLCPLEPHTGGVGRPSSRVIFPLDGTQHAAHQTDAGAPEGGGLRQAGEKPCVEPGSRGWGAPGRGAPGREALFPDEGGWGGQGHLFMSRIRDDLQRRVQV